MKKLKPIESVPTSAPALAGRWTPSMIAALLILLVYGWQVWTTVASHEPWRDEAQAWVYARDASLGELFADLRYEAHPALWYLVLLPFAKAGFSYDAMKVIHFAFVFATMALFLFRAPFPIWFKALCAFSFYFFWQYAIEMRVYAIGFFFLFLSAIFYETRFTRPLRYAAVVFLLANTNVHMLLSAGALAGAYALELLLAGDRDRRKWGAFAIMAAGALICLIQVGLIGGGTTHRYIYNVSEVHKFIVGALFVGVGPMETLLYGAVALLVILLLPLATRPLPLLIVASVLIANFGIALYKGSGLRHYGVVLLTLLWGWWIASREQDRVSWFARWPAFPDFAQRMRIALVALAIPLIICMPPAFNMHRMDRRADFSGTARMAAYLKQQNLLQYPIAMHRYWHLSSLPLHLPGIQFWNVALDQRVTYVRQDQASLDANVMPYEAAIRRAMTAVPPPQPLYLLLDVPADLSRAGFDLVYKVDETVFGSDERCYLYRRR